MKGTFLSLAVVALVGLTWAHPRDAVSATDHSFKATDTVPTRRDTIRHTDTTITPRADTASMAMQAQSTTPDVIITTFQAKYPNATNVTWSPYNRVEIPIDWEMTGWPALDTGDYVAEFDLDGQRYYAWYDATGTWIGSSAMLAAHGNLPKPVRDLLVRKYNGYTISKVDQEYDAGGTKYEIKLKKGDKDEVKLHVSDKGQVLKEKKKA